MENTGGGAHIAKDASANNDFIGRDQHSTNTGNQVHVAMERLSEASQRESETLNDLAHQIELLTRALTGDPFRVDGKGLVQQVREMDKINRRRGWWRVTLTIALVLLVIAQVAQWWFILRIYDLYYIIYSAVETIPK